MCYYIGFWNTKWPFYMRQISEANNTTWDRTHGSICTAPKRFAVVFENNRPRVHCLRRCVCTRAIIDLSSSASHRVVTGQIITCLPFIGSCCHNARVTVTGYVHEPHVKHTPYSDNFTFAAGKKQAGYKDKRKEKASSRRWSLWNRRMATEPFFTKGSNISPRAVASHLAQ